MKDRIHPRCTHLRALREADRERFLDLVIGGHVHAKRFTSETASAAPAWACAMLLAVMLSACSMKHIAVNAAGNMLSAGGEAFVSDDDPDLIREAVPFGLKTYESLLETSPDHEGLLKATSKGFVGYAYLLQQEADLVDAQDVNRARNLRMRASKLYLRGRDYALRGLELRHPGFVATLRSDAAQVLPTTTAADLPYLYWGGAGWAGALSAAKSDLQLVAELKTAGALLQRVLELDENYELGAAHELMIAYEGGRPGGSAQLARRHYARALELSEGKRASTHLALAEAVVVREQNLEEFESLLQAAFAVDPQADRKLRLVNTVAQRRARWLEARIPELFLEVEQKESTQ